MPVEAIDSLPSGRTPTDKDCSVDPVRLLLGRSCSVNGTQAVPIFCRGGLRHTLASHGCCSRGNPVGR